ncbi:hypothetical protein [Streptomyces sp. NPDC008150]|uniref:hypothetical protein n=1 Tax=Streptomyces sp. NPDC008150 TaxID=3364816 RepID=UPI0036E3FAB8
MKHWGRAALALVIPMMALTSTAGTASAAAGDGGCDNPRVLTLRTAAQDSTGTVEDINASGLAVGVSGQRPVYWTGKRVHKVPVPAGFDGGQVAAVNRHGLMVGWFTSGGSALNSTPFSYRAGASAATLLPTGGVSGKANDVNDHGRIVGTITGGQGGAVWRKGRLVTTLPVADGLSVLDATSVNDAGSVVANGRIWSDGLEDYLEVVLLWESVDAPPKVLGPSVGPWLQAWDRPVLDDHGRVVGALLSSVENDAVHWDPPEYGDPAQVASLAGFNAGRFTATSPHTQLAVGYAQFLDGGPLPADQAEVWPGTGAALALPRLTPDGASHAYAASDNGSVGGNAVDAAGDARPVVWTCAVKQAYAPTA